MSDRNAAVHGFRPSDGFFSPTANTTAAVSLFPPAPCSHRHLIYLVLGRIKPSVVFKVQWGGSMEMKGLGGFGKGVLAYPYSRVG